jgi:hypothetical protein
MKYQLLSFIFFLSITVTAQKPCEFSVNVTDSMGSYKSTKEYLVYEKNFAGNSSYIFNSIVVTDGTPILNVQFIEKSFDFIKAKCFDKNSKVYLQLNNNKIVTLLHINEESCGSMVRDDKGMNNRILTGYFMFRKEDYQDLKTSPISFIRIKYATDTADFILKKELKSELTGEVYEPDSYFINYFHCLEDKN